MYHFFGTPGMNGIMNDIESDILIFSDDPSLFASATDPAQMAAQLLKHLAKISILMEILLTE